MELASVNSATAALLAGVVTSLHCAGMCGPLVCMLAPGPRDRVDASSVAAVYHLSRLTAYMGLGAMVATLGRVPLGWATEPLLRWFPWVLVAYFGVVALGWERHIPHPRWLARWSLRLQAQLRGRNRLLTAGGVGLLTPLLPCGPLYFMVALTAFAGSAAHGAELMLAFGLGTVPLLWLAQSQFGWLRQRLGAVTMARVRSGLALIAAVIIGWRLRATLGFAGPDWENFLCH